MQIKTKHLLTALVVAGISAVAFPANAATIVNGDLLLGFRVTGGVGVGTDLIVNVGPTGVAGGNATVYRDANASIPSVVDLGTELTAIYGAGWADRGDLSWGVIGARNSTSTGGGNLSNGNVPGRSPFIGIAQSTSTPGVQSSSAPIIDSTTNRAATSGQIIGINTKFDSGTDTGVSSAEAIYLASNTIGGYTEQQASFFGLPGGTETSNASGIDNTGLDLYWILNSNSGALDNGLAVTSDVGTGVYQGSFQINSSGVVSFNAAAPIPEPSRALLGGLGLVALIFRRRRA